MHEPPAGLANDVLRAALATHYDLALSELTFLPLGHDASAWVYRAQTHDGASFFAKLRTEISNPAALRVPRYLHDHGVRQVVAPLATRAGDLWATAGQYALILYPYIAGTTGMAQGLTADQWRSYGTILRQIHATPVSAALAQHMRRESFAVNGGETIPQLDALLGQAQHAHAEAQALAEHWRTHRATIHTLLERAEQLGRRLAQAALPALLCHADIHTNNVLIDPAQQLWIVDWDETMLAPRERDLMFVAGGGISASLVGPHEEAWFFEGYGEAALDPLALAFYRAAWAISDMASFGEQACLRPDFGSLTRQEGVRFFAGLFAPGEIVAIALGSPTS